MKTALAMFLERDDARQALAGLDAAGYSAEEIGVLARQEAVEALLDEEPAENAAESAGIGALGGGALGGLIGLLAGASALVLPGLGPALAGGIWATVLGTTAAGAGIGAAYGGFVGALVGFGVAEEQTHIYEEGIERGGILLLVRGTDQKRLEAAAEILASAGGSGVDVVTKS
ncbi:MAG: hypothetical protein R3272_09100 [Candidatus Promineifilaceae bacterium]|nr:hypothetical protein [Candidatus Promineifilaceae bacterium]